MNSKMSVFVRFTFEGTHCWPSCPIEEVSFLRVPHRHIFHCEVQLPVTHTDRDVEFIWLKRKLLDRLHVGKDQCIDLGSSSCEDICNNLATYCFEITGAYPSKVIVSEDGENGAILELTA